MTTGGLWIDKPAISQVVVLANSYSLFSQVQSLNALRAYFTFFLGSLVLSSVFSSSEHFKLRPAVYFE